MFKFFKVFPALMGKHTASPGPLAAFGDRVEEKERERRGGVRGMLVTTFGVA